jgi:hypothetical protein
MKEDFSLFVATLALGSQLRQGLVRARAEREPRECGRMWEWTLTLSGELPFWELESRWTLKFLKNNCRGKNPLDWGVFYIIGKLLERRCLKWACMTHLDIWNTSYGQKKGRELTRFYCVWVVCDIPLKSSRWGLQLFFRTHLDQRFTHKVMGPQSCKLWESQLW